jgi:predicted RNase H-like HicB family nuclease
MCSKERGRKAMTDAELENLVQELANRPYRKVISGDDADGYLAEAPELPGCVTAGETVGEAEKMLRDAMEGWIEAALAAGEVVPEPEAVRV